MVWEPDILSPPKANLQSASDIGGRLDMGATGNDGRDITGYGLFGKDLCNEAATFGNVMGIYLGYWVYPGASNFRGQLNILRALKLFGLQWQKISASEWKSQVNEARNTEEACRADEAGRGGGCVIRGH